MSDEPLPSPLEPEEIPETPRADSAQNDLGDLRASMLEEEEQARLKARQNSGLLKKVTGMLRRRTGSLPGATRPFAVPETDESIPDEILAEQVGGGSPAREEPALVEEPQKSDVRPNDELLAEQIEKALADLTEREETPPPAPAVPAPLETKPLFLDEDLETEAPASEVQAAFLPEDLETGEPVVSPFSAEEIIAEAESETAAPGVAMADQADMAEGESPENIPDAAQPDSLRAELNPDMTPAAEAPQPKREPGLWKRFIHWLNPDSEEEVTQEVDAGVADELISDRLQRAQSSEFPPVIPGLKKNKDLTAAPTLIPEEAKDEPAPAVGEEEAWTGKSSPFSEQVAKQKRQRVLRVDWGAAKPIIEEEVNVGAAPETAEEAQNPARTPSRLTEVAAEGSEDSAPAIDEMRTIVLEDYVEPEAPISVAEVEPPRPFWQRGVHWVRQHMALIVPLTAALLIVLALTAVHPWDQAPIAQPNTPVPSELPYPVGLELTGGWFFDVGRSTIINGVWQPKSAEWLDNSQLRRVVALPWNKQTDAVIQTLERGDQINLIFSNNDLMPFLVRSVERLDKSDTEIFTENDPGLVIFLYGEESEQRWVVLALPK